MLSSGARTFVKIHKSLLLGKAWSTTQHICCVCLMKDVLYMAFAFYTQCWAMLNEIVGISSSRRKNVETFPPRKLSPYEMTMYIKKTKFFTFFSCKKKQEAFSMIKIFVYLGRDSKFFFSSHFSSVCFFIVNDKDRNLYSKSMDRRSSGNWRRDTRTRENSLKGKKKHPLKSQCQSSLNFIASRRARESIFFAFFPRSSSTRGVSERGGSNKICEEEI